MSEKPKKPFIEALKLLVILMTFSIIISIGIEAFGDDISIEASSNTTPITKVATNMYLVSGTDIIKLANMAKENIALKQEVETLKEVLANEREMFEKYRHDVEINKVKPSMPYPIIDFNTILLLGTVLGVYLIVR